MVNISLILTKRVECDIDTEHNQDTRESDFASPGLVLNELDIPPLMIRIS
jgi:hypothetical protein